SGSFGGDAGFTYNSTTDFATIGGLLASSADADDPSYSFASDTDTGIFLNGSNSIGFAAGGDRVGFWDSIGLTLTDTVGSLDFWTTNPSALIEWKDDTGTQLRAWLGLSAGTMTMQQFGAGQMLFQ